jgi:hypothetical protein
VGLFRLSVKLTLSLDYSLIMGFLDKAKQLAATAMASNTQAEGREITLVFGPSLMAGYKEIVENKGKIKSVEVHFPHALMSEISDAINSHQPSAHVAYTDDMQFLDVVGESFYKDNLKELHEEHGDGWMYGFLMPEPLNPHDTNAVSVLVITDDEDGKLGATQVGYLGREQAKKTQSKIIKHLENGLVIPVLLKLTGGETGKENLGVMARAKHSKIKF